MGGDGTREKRDATRHDTPFCVPSLLSPCVQLLLLHLIITNRVPSRLPFMFRPWVSRFLSTPRTTDDSYDVPVDPKQQDKATTMKLHSFRRPHMRAFHFAWFGFFMAFVSWFAFAPLMKEIKADLGMSKLEVYNANISSVASTILSRFVVGPLIILREPQPV